MCPKGDDPLTVGQKDRALQIKVVGGGSSISGFIRISFQLFTTEIPLDSTLSE